MDNDEEHAILGPRLAAAFEAGKASASHSPLPKKRLDSVDTPKIDATKVSVLTGSMNFYDALHQMMNGERLTRLEWNDPTIYLTILETILVIHKPDGFHPLTVSTGDINGTDWVIVNV